MDGDKAFKAAFVAPGLFEQTHHLCEITRALMYYITNEDEMHDLLKYLTEWELEVRRVSVPTCTPTLCSITTTGAAWTAVL